VVERAPQLALVGRHPLELLPVDLSGNRGGVVGADAPTDRTARLVLFQAGWFD